MNAILQGILERLPPIEAGPDAQFTVTYGGRYPMPRAIAQEWLRDHLYANYYVHGGLERLEVAPVPGRPNRQLGDPDLLTRFYAAVGPTTTWEPGWKLVSRADTGSFVSNGRVTLFVEDPRQLDPSGAAPGDQVRLRLTCAREGLSLGFFYVVSPAGPNGPDGPLLRLYLNLTPEGAPEILRALIALGTESGQRFEAKFANAYARYGRADTAVVYTQVASYPAVRACLLELNRAHPAWWRPAVPLFTKPLGVGLAAAENPQTPPEAPKVSFGQHRCALVAEGILAAIAAGDATHEAMRARIATAFAQADTSLETPYAIAVPPEFF